MLQSKEEKPLFCFRCGETIPERKDIAATFDGNFHRWDDRLYGKASFQVCKKCLEATDLFLDEEKRQGMLELKKMNEGWQ